MKTVPLSKRHSIADQRYYGEAPGRLRGYERAAGDAVPSITSKMRILGLSGIASGMGGSAENSEEPSISA
jgi:hypothetical protein